MDDREVSHEHSRPSDTLLLLKSLPSTHRRACHSSPHGLSCPPGLAVCCSRRRLNDRQARGCLPRWGLRVQLLSEQREGAQLYQQHPSVPALMLSNQCLDGEWSQEMSSPVESLGHDVTTPFHSPRSLHLFLVLIFPRLGLPPSLRRNQPETLSNSTRYAMVQ